MVAFPDLAPVTTAFSDWLTHLLHQTLGWGSQISDTLTNVYVQIRHALGQAWSSLAAPLGSPVFWQAIVYWGLLLVMGFGIVGAFVPALPGITLIVGAVVIWGLVKGFAGLALPLGVAIAALILSLTIDYLAGIIGAQRVGASQWGQIGAIIGMLLGLFGFLPALPIGGPIFGILFGTVLGAFVGEFLHRRELQFLKRVQQSFKVGIAIVVGNLVGNILQGLLALLATIVFIVTTWGSALGG